MEKSEKYRLVEKPDGETEPSETKRRHPNVKVKSVIPTDNEKSEVIHMRQIKEQNLTNPLRVDTKVINAKFHRSRSIHTAYQNEFFGNLRNTRFLRDCLDALDSHNGLVICLAEPWKRNFLPNRNRGKEFLKSECVQNSCLKEGYALSGRNKSHTSGSLLMKVKKLLENSNMSGKLKEIFLVYTKNKHQITDKDYLFSTTPSENREENCKTIRKNEERVRSQPQTGDGARVISRPGIQGGGGSAGGGGGGGGGGDPVPPGGLVNGAVAAPGDAGDGIYENGLVNGNASGSSGDSGNGDGNDPPDVDGDDGSADEQEALFWEYVADIESLTNNIQHAIDDANQTHSQLEAILGNSHTIPLFRGSLFNVSNVTWIVQQHITNMYFVEIDGENHLNELKNFMLQMFANLQGHLFTINGYLAVLQYLAQGYGQQGWEIVNALNAIGNKMISIWQDSLLFIQHTINHF